MAQNAELESVRLGIQLAKAQEDVSLKVSEVEERAVMDKARLSTEVAKALLDDDIKRNRKG